jgi:hypothetical protein
MAKTSTPTAPAATANGGAAKPEKKMTKMEAVRRAQAALGKKAKPLAIQEYVKDEFNIDITTAVISTYKKDIARKAKKGKGQALRAVAAQVKPAPVAASAARETAPAVPKPAASGGIPLKDVLAVKELVGRLGAGPLHTLIDAFTK